MFNDPNTKLEYIKEFTAAGSPNIKGQVSIAEITNMQTEEFYNIRNRLLICRDNVRYDTAVFKHGVAVDMSMTPLLFDNGIGEQNPLANAPGTTYKQGLFHTNMSNAGNFGTGSLTIVYEIEAEVQFCALQGAVAGYENALAYGADTNPLGNAPAAYDPFLLEKDVLNQWQLSFIRDEQTIIKNKLKFFPVSSGISGAAGASVGAIAQNISFGDDPQFLKNPQVFVDNEDFNFQLTPLAPFDLTAATGLDIGFRIVINLRTIEWRQVRP